MNAANTKTVDKWWVCGLLLLALMLNYMDRQTLSLTITTIQSELGLDDGHYGRLERAFGYAFAFGGLFMGLLAGQQFDSTLVGDSSLMKRPMERAAGPLRQMGAMIETVDGKPPVRIRGGRRLHGIDFAMPVASAQVKSAVLLAGLFADGVTRVTEPATTRDHTERMLRGFGVQIEREGSTISLVGGQQLRATHVAVPAPFSSSVSPGSGSSEPESNPRILTVGLVAI